MVEFVMSAPDAATFAQAAIAMGYFQDGHILTVGEIASGGSWFFNYVGPIQQAPGVWARLRHNGDPAELPALPPNSGLTIYAYSDALGGWAADGATLAPEWLGSVGLIA